jgi:hypothetical protein
MSSDSDPFNFATFAGSSGLTHLADLTELNAQFGAGSPRPGESFDLFVRVAKAGDGGGGGATTSPGLEDEVTGVELIVLPEAYCCGLVGSKGKFCTVAKPKCKVQSHAKTKADVKRTSSEGTI